MFARLLLIFIFVPLADLVLLMILSKFNLLITVGAVVVSGIIGAWLAKRQGLAVGTRIREKLSKNQVPADLFTDGAMILFAAGLLITPGIITDLFGFSLLISPCRAWYKKFLVRYAKSHFKVQVFHNGQMQSNDPNVVDGAVVNERSPNRNPDPPFINSSDD